MQTFCLEFIVDGQSKTASMLKVKLPRSLFLWKKQRSLLWLSPNPVFLCIRCPTSLPFFPGHELPFLVLNLLLLWCCVPCVGALPRAEIRFGSSFILLPSGEIPLPCALQGDVCADLFKIRQEDEFSPSSLWRVLLFLLYLIWHNLPLQFRLSPCLFFFIIITISLLLYVALWPINHPRRSYL